MKNYIFGLKKDTLNFGEHKVTKNYEFRANYIGNYLRIQNHPIAEVYDLCYTHTPRLAKLSEIYEKLYFLDSKWKC